MPRIVHVISTPSGFGGAERVMAALVTAGRTKGWDQIILNPFAREPMASEIAARCAPTSYEGKVCTRTTEIPALWSWVNARLTSLRPDITHVHLFHALVAVASLPRGGRVRVVTHHHGALLKMQGRRLEALLDRWGGRRFDKVVAVSDAVRTFLIDEYGYETDRVCLIRNGWAGNASSVEKAHRPTVVCVGNFREEKDHELLIRAFAGVREAIPPAQLILIGEGVLRERLVRVVTEEGLQENVRFVGFVADVWPFLSEAHVFALPSRYETAGISVLEAMAAGLPVVAADVGAIPEIVRPGETGVIFAAGDGSALTQILIELLRDESKRLAMGLAAKQLVAPLSEDAMVARYFDLYERLLVQGAH